MDDDYKKLFAELKEDYKNCNELFDIAYKLNCDENTRTAFTQKVTSYMPRIMQTIGYLIGIWGKELIKEKILEDSYKLDEEYGM